MMTKGQIQTLISSNDRALCRAIIAIYERQEESEKAFGNAKVRNGVGFNSFDASLLTSFAQQLQKGRKLSPKQLEVARKRMTKYSGQLVELANEKSKLTEGDVGGMIPDFGVRHEVVRTTTHTGFNCSTEQLIESIIAGRTPDEMCVMYGMKNYEIAHSV